MPRRCNGEGSCYQDSRGVWRGAIRLPSGKRAYRQAKSRAKLVAKLDELKRGGNPSRETFGAFLDRWLAHVKPNVRGNTYVGYETACRLHIRPAIGEVRLSVLRAEHAERVMAALRDRRRSVRTVSFVRSVCVMSLALAERWGLVEHNPFRLTDAPRKAKTTAKPFTNEEALAFLSAAESWKDRALMILAAHTGARRGELLGAKWQDFDGSSWRVARTLIRVQGKQTEFPPKSEAGYRRLTLPQQALDALRELRTQQRILRMKAGPAWADNDYVFTGAHGQPLQPEYVYDSFLALLVKAELPRHTFKDLRHSIASLMLARGVAIKSVQGYMGHATAAITIDTYGHLYPENAARSPLEK